MKVLQVLYSGLGGHGSVVTSLINADKKNEWEHCLLFYGVEDLLPAYRNFCESKKIPYKFIKKTKGVFSFSGAAVRKVMRKFNPDAIILHSPNLILPAWLFALGKKKIIIEVEHTPHHIKSTGERTGTFLSFLLGKKVICLTQAYLEELKRRFRILPVKKKSIVIPNGIDLENFFPVDKVVRDELHFGMIGRFSKQKSQEMIINAAHKLITSDHKNQEMHFHFAGTGEMEEYLKIKVSKSDVRKYIHFHGLLNEDGIIDFLGKLDVYVHASTSETMCTSVMQAMACGLPVVGSNIPGINNLIQKDISGLLFENNNLESLIRSIEKITGDRQKRLQMGANARNYAEENFSSATTFSKYDQLLKSVITS